MALALDQSLLGSNSGGAGTSIVITTTAAAAAGARIVVFVAGDATVSSITDSNGNTYAQDRAQGSNLAVWSAHSASALASSSSITVTYSASSNPTWAAASSFTGVPTSSAVDQVNSRSGFNSDAWTSSSITPTVTPSLVVGMMHSGGGLTATSAPDAGWTELFDGSVGSNNRTAVYQIVSDTSARNPSGVFSASQSGADQFGVTVNYKEAAGDAPAPALRVVQSNLRWA